MTIKEIEKKTEKIFKKALDFLITNKYNEFVVIKK